MGSHANPRLIAELVQASYVFDAKGVDPERNCWLAVHRHLHGMLPSEYDIREIDEDLYLAVLACRISQTTSTDSDLNGLEPLA